MRFGATFPQHNLINFFGRWKLLISDNKWIKIPLKEGFSESFLKLRTEIRPIKQNRTFSLKELVSKAEICKTEFTFEETSQLEIPESLKKFLQEYHLLNESKEIIPSLSCAISKLL